MNIKRILLTVLAAATAVAAAFCEPVDYFPADKVMSPANPKHEMRGAWIATVYGIDWPSRTGSGAAVVKEQQQELRRILDILKEGGLNAVFFQVRSMSDAMYASSYEPWSAYLTGTRGADPGWDPLAFAIGEAHSRGMELHVWVNPFRLANGPVPEAAKAARGTRTFDPAGKGWAITFSSGGAPTRKTAKGKRRTAKTAGGKTVSVLDPGNAAARAHIVEVCREIVKNYDVDGLVFDDYFYPDRLPLGAGYDFAEWKKDAGDSGVSQEDWRRGNVAKTVAAVHDMVMEEKPWVRFGISPAGVAGGNGKATEKYGLPLPEAGKDWMYDRIFCDPLEWLAAGTVDYVSPQIYWACCHETNPYEPIARWWGKVAMTFGRHCYPSQKVVALPASDEAWKEQELQVNINRANSLPTDAGSVFYSTAHISGKKAAGLAEYLHAGVYAAPALMPPMEWRGAENPGAVGGLRRAGSELKWNGMKNMRYVVYAVPDTETPLDVISDTGANFDARHIMCVTYDNHVTIDPGRLKGYWFAVAPYDRYGNEWEATILN